MMNLRMLLPMLALMLGVSSTHADAEPPSGADASDVELVETFDANGDGWLNLEERKAARVKLLALQKEQATARQRPGRGRGGRGGPGGPGGPGGRRQGTWPAATPGPEVAPENAPSHPRAGVYDPDVLRTFFITFELEDWEEELAIFKPTDVEVPATLVVDGKTYPGVGMSFRGASSFFRIPAGSKRSLNLSIDLVDGDQRLYGVKTLNLLNCMGDPSMMSGLLYSHIARQKIAAPKVNFVKVVINGRSWGIYANAEQFNKDFLKANFGKGSGGRWKAHGSPRGDAGLRYLGEDIEPYRERFEIKSKDKKKSWRALIELCRLLHETPADDIPQTLSRVLDLDSVLWFLAVDIAVVNSDGYWTRASDYNLCQDKDGRFHVVPHDMNEAFRDRSRRAPPEGAPGDGAGPGGGPGARGPRGEPRGGPPGRGGGRGRDRGPTASVELDPLANVDGERFPLRSKLLANDALRTRYLQYVRLIATTYLDWDHLGPRVGAARALIEKEVEADTRKLITFEAFQRATDAENGELRQFCERRAAYLLGLGVIKNLPEKLVPIPSDK